MTKATEKQATYLESYIIQDWIRLNKPFQQWPWLHISASGTKTVRKKASFPKILFYLFDTSRQLYQLNHQQGLPNDWLKNG